MEVRNNTFSHRITDDDVKNAIPDISQRKESVVEQCYNTSRNFGELEWEENLYAPGLSHSNHDPLTGCLKQSRNMNVYQHSYSNTGYTNNAMIPNPMAYNHNWQNHAQNNYSNGNQTQQPRFNNFNNGYNGAVGSNQSFQSGNKRPRGGYKGSNYSDNFAGKSDGQSNGRKGGQNK
jgi:hypothetical protein